MSPYTHFHIFGLYFELEILNQMYGSFHYKLLLKQLLHHLMTWIDISMDVYMYYNNPFPFSILQPDILVHQSYEEVFLWFPATPLKSYFAPNHFRKYYVLHIYSNHNNLQYLLASDIPDTLLHFSVRMNSGQLPSCLLGKPKKAAPWKELPFELSPASGHVGPKLIIAVIIFLFSLVECV